MIFIGLGVEVILKSSDIPTISTIKPLEVPGKPWEALVGT
jgi:hypothetical protein